MASLLVRLLDHMFKYEVSSKALLSFANEMNDDDILVADCFDWANDEWLHSFIDLALRQGFISKLLVSRFHFPSSLASNIASYMTEERFYILSSSFLSYSLKNSSLMKDTTLQRDLAILLRVV